jgi:hypothetical protein
LNEPVSSTPEAALGGPQRRRPLGDHVRAGALAGLNDRLEFISDTYEGELHQPAVTCGRVSHIRSAVTSSMKPCRARGLAHDNRKEHDVKRTILAIGIATALVAIGATAFAGIAATKAPTTADPVWTTILKARKATAKYQDVRQALKDGYVRDSPCVQDPTLGAMGIHYLNAAYAANPSIQAGKPELLLYFPEANGALRLVAVEYFRPDADQDLATTDDRPSLAGIPFDGPMEGHNPTMPRHYDLHVWVWNWNPAGVFAQFNPTLHC